VDVPIQYFQSVITIELAVAGALLWQIHYFRPRDATNGEELSDPRLRLGVALVLGATVFGSLWAMADEGPKWAAIAVTLGLAISLVPILLRILPPLAKDAKTNARDPNFAITVAALLAYSAVVAGFLIVLDIE
jgi:peptidoglycan/LPS O-acetylase OafA/YrhL